MRSRAVVAIDLASIRAEPRDGAEQVSQALPGEPLLVERRWNGWTRIRTAYDYPGWIRDSLLENPDPSSSTEDTIPVLGRATGASGVDPVEEARAYLGAPYEWGGMTKRGIDCSGLVHMAFRRTGRVVPRDSYQQESAGEDVPESRLRTGDLACYEGHIAFWLGGGRLLHATQRAGVNGVVEEQEPVELKRRFRRYVRL